MQPHILVVDDDPTVLEVLSSQLSEYQVNVASSGEAALEQVRRNGFDLVIADVRMPDMDGVELLDNIRKLRPEVVRFILTGYVDAHAEAAAQSQHGVYKFKKPWGEELLTAVRRALESQETTRTLRRRLGLVLRWLEVSAALEVCAGPEETLATLGRWLEELDGVKRVGCYILRRAALECIHSSARLTDVSFFQTDNPVVRCITEGTITVRNEDRLESTRCLGSGASRGVVQWSVREGDAETTCLVNHALAVTSLALRTHGMPTQTEMRPEEAQLRRFQQLAAMGRLLAIVLHEIASPLGAMLSRLEMLRAGLEKDSTASEHLNVLSGQLQRVTAILDRARQVARPPSPDFTTVELTETITSTVSLVGYHYRTFGVLITLELPDEEVLVNASAGELQQVWLNLLSNAFEAIQARSKGSGGITIRVQHRKKQGEVEVSITDNGAGMTPEVLKRLETDPDFFTTRPDGMGLGVAESRRIIAEHLGTLSYASQPGKGTTATVRLSTMG